MSDSQNLRALALVGMPGAGKSSCALHLEERGFFQFRFGGIVQGEVEARGLEVNAENERVVREELRARHGMAAMAVIALPRLKAALAERPNIVIDGLYSWSEYKFLQENLGAALTVVAVTCTRHIRYERLAKRRIRPLTNAEAATRDWAEIENLEKGGPIAMADYTFNNDGTTNALIDQLNGLLVALNFTP